MTDDTCGCDDYALSRRSLLKASGLAAMGGVVTSMFGDVLTSTVLADEPAAAPGNVLVVLSMRGGADGMSLVVPHAEDAYYAARPTTAVKAEQLLHADATFGLHPSFAPLDDLWTSGRFAALHAVGLPAPNRSHFDAMEAVEDADPGTPERIGWINRMVSGLAAHPDVFDGMQLGNDILPTSLVGPAPTLATVGFSDLKVPFGEDDDMRPRIEAALRTRYAGRADLIGGAGVDALTLASRSASIASVVDEGPQHGASYQDGSSIADALKSTAALIRTGVGVKAVAVDYGGWDNHVGLKATVSGQITEMSKAIAAFFVDLGALGDRVTLVTLSEFGRRLQENGSAGVDHGYGNAVLVVGAGVDGGQFYSRWPTLAQGNQVDGDLAVTTDYRDVLSEILLKRFPSVDRSAVFPGLGYSPLGFMA